MEDKRIAVFFPGIGYTNDKPLLYYARKLYKEVMLDREPPKTNSNKKS